jgi:hypothetical protein
MINCSYFNMNVYMCVTLFQVWWSIFLEEVKGEEGYVCRGLSESKQFSINGMLAPCSCAWFQYHKKFKKLCYHSDIPGEYIYSNESYKFAPPSELEIFFLANLELAS